MHFDEMLEAFFDAIKQRDFGRLLSVVSIDEDVSLILLNGAYMSGRVPVTNLHSAWLADPDWLMDFKILRTVETSEMGFALLLVDYSDPTYGAQPYAQKHYLSLVFVKRGGKWFLTHDQTTVGQEG